MGPGEGGRGPGGVGKSSRWNGAGGWVVRNEFTHPVTKYLGV